LTLEGSDLFVGCGMGVVFVLDPATGLIRFAQRYDRVGTPNQALRQFGWQVNRMEFDGWREDVIIPYGRQMICFASDSDKIFAIDRSSGELIWFVEMNPLGKKIDYLIGIHNDRLYAGGSETVVAFDLLGEGRMAWGGDALFDGGVSMGKAMLCGDALYVPVNDSIWKFTLPQNTEELPQKVAQAHVDLGTSAPVGNLFSDGKRIWVHQGNRVSALAPIAASSTPSETPAEIDTLANATDSQDAVLESTDSRATPLLKPRTDPQPFSPTLPNNQ
jgi:hypothetical protein